MVDKKTVKEIINDLLFEFDFVKKKKNLNYNENFFQIGFDSLQLASLEFQIIKKFCFLNIAPGFCYCNFSPQKIIDQINKLQTVNNTSVQNLDNNILENLTNLSVDNKSNFNLQNNKENTSNSFNIPLSQAQKRFWYMCHKKPTKNYVEEFFVELPLDMSQNLQKLQNSLNYVIANTKILRVKISIKKNLQKLYSLTESYFVLSTLQNLNDYYTEKIDIVKSSKIPLKFAILIKENSTKLYTKFHNILIDGKSIRLFFENIMLTFNKNCFEKKKNTELDYINFCYEEEKYINECVLKFEKNFDAILEFWYKMLKNCQQCALQNDVFFKLQNNKNKNLSNFKTCEKVISATDFNIDIYTGLNTLAKKSNTTFFSINIAILRILLYKMFTIKNACLGIPIENRHFFTNQYEKTIGLFLNFCIVSEVVDENITVKKFIQNCSETILQILKYSKVSFNTIISKLRKRLDFNGSDIEKLIQIVVIQDSAIEDDFENFNNLASFKISQTSFTDQQYEPQYPLMWHFVESKKNKNFKIKIEYDEKIFSESLINEILKNYQKICLKIIVNNFILINKLNLFNDEELNLQINLFHKNICCFPNQHPIIPILKNLKKLSSKKVVVKDGYRQNLTAKKLLVLSKTIASIFLADFFKSKSQDNQNKLSVVVILHKRNINLIPLILATWISGSTVLTISNDWPIGKIMDVLNKLILNFKLIFITDKKKSEFKFLNQQYDILFSNFLFKKALFFLEKKILLKNYFKIPKNKLLYLTFTSGSTGFPKLIGTKVEGVMNLIMNYTALFYYNNKSIVYQVVNYAFDIFFSELLAALLNSAKLYLAKDIIPSLQELKKCTHAYIMPTYLSQIDKLKNLFLLSKLKIIQFGGEKISKNWLIKACKAKIKLVQLFGLTEATVYSAYQFLTIKEILNNNFLNIGTPFYNVHLFTVDLDNQTIPNSLIGAQGFLCIGGISVGKEYNVFNNNNENLCFHNQLKINYIKTSDRVKILPNNSLQFLGRNDQLVKLKGNLIDLEYCEKLVATFSKNITNCAAIVFKKKLIFFILYKQSIKFSIKKKKNVKDKLFFYLKNYFPIHALPNHIFIVSKLPLNSNSKLDKQALQCLYKKKVGKKTICIKNKNILYFSKKICKIFANHLQVKSIKPKDNLFLKGADSLNILMCIQEIELKLKIKLNIDDFFEYKSIQKILKHSKIHNKLNKIKLKNNVINNTNRCNLNFIDNIPLSHNQQQLCLLNLYNTINDKKDLINDAYLISLVLHLNGKLNKLIFVFAINSLILQNAVLRTVLMSKNNDLNNIHQVILSGTETFIYPYTYCNEECLNNIQINLSTEIPIKFFNLMQKVNECSILFKFHILFHHIAVDGLSLNIISTKLCFFYKNYNNLQFLNEKSVDAYNYVYFSIKQNKKNYDKKLVFWMKELNNVKNLTMSNVLTKQDKVITNFDTKMKNIKLEITINTNKLNKTLKKYSCTASQFFIAVYASLLYFETKNKNIIVFGTPFSNRSLQYNNTIGYFATMHAVCVSFLKIKILQDLIYYIRKKLLSIAKHADVPFDLIVKKLKPIRKYGINPIFQKVFSFEKNNQFNFELANFNKSKKKKNVKKDININDRSQNNYLKLGKDLHGKIYELTNIHAKFDQYWRLTNLMHKEKNTHNFQLLVEYNSNLFDSRTVVNSLKLYKKILNLFLNNSTVTLKNLKKKLLKKKIKKEKLDYSKYQINNVDINYDLKLENVNKIIKSIWSKILNIDNIEDDNNFFELGGHSLLANRICNQIENILHVECKLPTLFQYQTINELSKAIYSKILSKYNLNNHKSTLQKHVDTNQKNKNIIDNLPLQMPCCYLQESIFQIYNNLNLTSNNLSESHIVFAYTIFINIQLNKKILLSKLKHCISTLIKINPILQTVFEIDSKKKLVQKILPICNVENYFIGEGWNNNNRFDSKIAVNNNKNFCIFDPFKGPLIKFVLSNNFILRIEASHLIFDGISVNVLSQQLLNLYNNKNYYSKTEKLCKIAYFNFAKRFNEKCNAKEEEMKIFWESIFKQFDFDNHIITDKIFTKNQTTLQKSNEVLLSFKELNVAVGKVCKNLQITPLSIFIFALGKLIQQKMSSFYSNFFIGTVVDMRDLEKLNNEIGFFVNTLPIPFFTNKTKTTLNTLKNLNEIINKIINQFSFISYSRLLKIAKKDSLFDVMIVIDNFYQNKKMKAIFEKDHFSFVPFKMPATKFKITFFIELHQTDIKLRIEYLEHLFDNNLIEILGKKWAEIIFQLAKYNHINSIELIKEEFLSDDTKNIHDYPNFDIFYLINEQAKLTPNILAIQTPEKKKNITYKNFVSVIDALSLKIMESYFEQIGNLLIPDTIIAIFGRKNCTLSVILSLAVIKAGGAYLPIDAEVMPILRIKAILTEANAKFGISVSNLFETNNFDNFFVDKPQKYLKIIQNVNKKLLTNFIYNITPCFYTNLAYVIFTSGTTGKPKGVTIERRSILNMIVDATKLFFVNVNDGVYQFTNFCFDNSVLEIFLALVNGARLFVDDIHQENENRKISSNLKYFNSQRFCEQIEKFNITYALLFPALVDSFEDSELSKLRKCRYWISGAEKLPQTLMERTFNFGVHVIQVYGPTECTCYMLSKRMRPNDNAQNLGKPFRNTQITVRTPSGDVAIPGTAHQLYVSGIGLTRGYLNRTLENQPFCYFNNKKYYSTGDIVKQTHRGEIIFIGRIDNQLKIRGFRVEISDIESVLLKITEIKTAKVIVDEKKNNDLIAYVVFKEKNCYLTEKELRKLCLNNLPYYMVPRLFITIDNLPLTANSKIDTKNLSNAASTKEKETKEKNEAKKKNIEYSKKLSLRNTFNVMQKEKNNTIKKILNSSKSFHIQEIKKKLSKKLFDKNYQTTSTKKNTCHKFNVFQCKKKIIEIFSTNLNIPDIEKYYDCGFIYLGGNSLNGQRIINKISDLYKLPPNLLTLEYFLDTNLTILNIIDFVFQLISNKTKKKNLNLKNSLKKLDSNKFNNLNINTKNIALSFQQEQMLFLSQIDSNNIYTLPLVQKFTLNINLILFHNAFMRVVMENAILRTTIYETKECDFFQQILSGTECFYAVFNSLSEFCAIKTNSFFNKKFNLFSGSTPLKLQLFYTDSHYILVLLIHHIASDATSTNILESEIMQKYNNLKLNKNINHLNIKNFLQTYNYHLWSIEQKKVNNQKTIFEKANFLANNLNKFLFDQIILQDLFLNKAVKKYDNSCSTFKILLPLSKIKQSGFTLFSFVCMTFVKAIIKFFHVQKKTIQFNNLIIGSPVSNRTSFNTEKTIGNFLNNIILLINLNDFMNLQHNFNKLNSFLLEKILLANKFSDVPFGKIFEAIRKTNAANIEKIYDVYINCRYELENEFSLQKMEEVIIDRNFTEEFLKNIRQENNVQNHFIEIDVDQFAQDFEITIRILLPFSHQITSSEKTQQMQQNFNTNIFEEHSNYATFFNIFKETCYSVYDHVTLDISEKVFEVIRETVPVNLNQITKDQTFFSVGGNSLLLIKFKRKLEQKFNIEIDIIELVKNLQIEAIIQYCKDLINTNNNIKNSKINNCCIKSNFINQRDFNEKKNSIVIQQLYSTLPNTKLCDLLIVLFHPLIGGNFCYMGLRESFKTLCKKSMIIVGIQHPETFYQTNENFPTNSLKDLAKFYAEKLENYIKLINFSNDLTKIIFIGASMGAIIAYECCILLHDVISVHFIISIDGNAIVKEKELIKKKHINEMYEIIKRQKEDKHFNGQSFNDWLDVTTRDHMIQNAWNLLLLRFNHTNTKWEYKDKIRMILLKAKDEKLNQINENDDFGWQSLGVNLIDIDWINGNHNTMLDTVNCNNLVKKILSYL